MPRLLTDITMTSCTIAAGATPVSDEVAGLNPALRDGNYLVIRKKTNAIDAGSRPDMPASSWYIM
jgi:hypothetical protein